MAKRLLAMERLLYSSPIPAYLSVTNFYPTTGGGYERGETIGVYKGERVGASLYGPYTPPANLDAIFHTEAGEHVCTFSLLTYRWNDLIDTIWRLASEGGGTLPVARNGSASVTLRFVFRPGEGGT
jgi:hypothetical protein